MYLLIVKFVQVLKKKTFNPLLRIICVGKSSNLILFHSIQVGSACLAQDNYGVDGSYSRFSVQF